MYIYIYRVVNNTPDTLPPLSLECVHEIERENKSVLLTISYIYIYYL